MRSQKIRAPRAPWLKPQVKRFECGCAEFAAGVALPDGPGSS
jgi:hypothetical protein